MHFKAENLRIPKHPRLLFLAQNLRVLRPSKTICNFFWDTLYEKNGQFLDLFFYEYYPNVRKILKTQDMIIVSLLFRSSIFGVIRFFPFSFQWLFLTEQLHKIISPLILIVDYLFRTIK